MNSLEMPGLKYYYKQVRKSLTAPQAEKDRIIDMLKSNVIEYLAVHANAGVADIIDHFGKPEMFQFEYLATLDDWEINRKVRLQNSFRKWLITLVLALFILLAIICIWLTIEKATGLRLRIRPKLLTTSTVAFLKQALLLTNGPN